MMFTKKRFGAGVGLGLGLAISVGVGSWGAVPAFATTTDETLNSVSAATPETIANAAVVPTAVASENAIHSTVGRVDVTIPVDPAAGITLDADGRSVSIGLPFTPDASSAKVEQEGVVSYDNNNGSTTVPVVQTDGSVQINTVIDNAAAPTRYEYPITLPAFANLTAVPDGSVNITDAAGAAFASIAAPWAKGSNGSKVATRYEISGTSLIQIVEHNVRGTVYPVVADPTVSYLWWGVAYKLSNSETRDLAANFGPAYFINAVCGFTGPAAPICALAVNIRLWTWQKPVNDAARQGRCAQLNYPYGSGPALWNMTNERC
ncbi:hypothetical protein [Cryobacterium sp. CG_9.6]|uniref:hypothetical protein n=1 Tax=Cryobacterium sp. CG_9.6 TaxID=2760710 RepID=UPI002475B927|nr:hypothetical protein [Cryobacterium sp. CG_9.6]MDH6238214.1 hypothetical protein [Cryobacterium sp. CG_9.6]